MAQPITRTFLSDLMAVLDLPDPVVEFGSLQVEPDQDIDLRRFFEGRPFTGTDFREGPGVDRVEDIRALSYEDGTVGTALCLDTLEHCADPPQACRELRRVVDPDGGVCVLSSVMLFGIHGYPSDYFRFTPEGFRVMLDGFDDVRVCGVGHRDIPREVFAVAARGRDLGHLDLTELPSVRAAQAVWDSPATGVPIGPLRVAPGELARIVARELPRVAGARLRTRRSRR